MSGLGIELLEEPALEFRYAQKHTEPHHGLSLFGPLDSDASARPGIVTHGVVGTRGGIVGLQAFLDRLHYPVFAKYGDPAVITKAQFLWPTFPGLTVAFACDWPTSSGWSEEISGTTLTNALKNMDPHKRAFDVCSIYLQAIQRAAQRDDRLSVIICVVPDDIWDACRPLSKIYDGIGRRPSGSEVLERRSQPDLFEAYDPEQYDYSVDCRRQLRARSMEFDIPLQLVRESTLKPNDEFSIGERRLTPLSDRAWNLGTGLYYKAGGKPWRLTSARDGVCYVGLAFRKADFKGDAGTACCAAQMFLDTGDGVVFRGEFGPWYSTERRQFELSKEASKNLLAGVLETYRSQGGKDLREVFIHSRSWIPRDSYNGFVEACPEEVKVVGVRVRRDYDTRLLRPGKFPVIRGTMWKISDSLAYLFASGFKSELLTYDGWSVPVPLRIDVQHGTAEIGQVCRDILGLTKLNYNACKIADAQPVTVGFSDAVGEILIGNPTIRVRRPNFRFYI